MEEVGEDGAEGEDESQDVQPERGADTGADIFAKTKFQQESGEPDGGHYDQCQRAEECGAAGVDHNQGERKQKQSGSDDAPAAGLLLRLGRRDRVGSGIGQEVPSKLYRAERGAFKSWAGRARCRELQVKRSQQIQPVIFF